MTTSSPSSGRLEQAAGTLVDVDSAEQQYPPARAVWTDLLKIECRPACYEIAFILLAPIYIVLISRTHLPFSPSIAKIFAGKLLEVVLLVYGLSFIVIAVRGFEHALHFGRRSLMRKQTLIMLVRPYWTLDFFIRTFRRGAVLFAAIYLFLHLKHLVIWLNHSNYDLFFWNLDRTLHFGIQPNIWLIEHFGLNTDFAILVDWLYFKYFAYKLIVSLFFLMDLKGKELSERFFCAYVLLWMLGGLAYLAAPADGPCYSVLLNSSVPAEERSHVFTFPVVRKLDPNYVEKYENSKIWTAKVYQQRLWSDRREFLKGERLPGVFYGIAAMPSLHVAAVTLLAIFLWQASPFLGGIGIVYAVIVFVGSVFLQWHYAVDGYAGFALAVLIALFSLRIFPRPGKSDKAAAAK